MRTIKRLLNLPTLVPYALSDAEKQDFEDQVRALLVDSKYWLVVMAIMLMGEKLIL